MAGVLKRLLDAPIAGRLMSARSALAQQLLPEGCQDAVRLHAATDDALLGLLGNELLAPGSEDAVGSQKAAAAELDRLEHARDKNMCSLLGRSAAGVYEAEKQQQQQQQVPIQVQSAADMVWDGSDHPEPSQAFDLRFLDAVSLSRRLRAAHGALAAEAQLAAAEAGAEGAFRAASREAASAATVLQLSYWRFTHPKVLLHLRCQGMSNLNSTTTNYFPTKSF